MEIKTEHLEQLRKVTPFKYFEEKALGKLLEIADVNDYSRGDLIIAEGETSPYLFAVLNGTVNVSVDDKGKQIFICAIGAGDVFGEAGIFSKVKRTASVTSTENTTIARIHRDALLAFIKEMPSDGVRLLLYVIYSLIKKLRFTNQELAFERKFDIEQDDIDDLIDSALEEK